MNSSRRCIAAERPSLENYLEKVDEEAQPALFRELLLIELHYLASARAKPGS